MISAHYGEEDMVAGTDNGAVHITQAYRRSELGARSKENQSKLLPWQTTVSARSHVLKVLQLPKTVSSWGPSNSTQEPKEPGQI